MSGYGTLVSLIIEHDYFAGAECHALSCVPDPVTVKFVQDCELVLRPQANGVSVYFDRDRTAALAVAVEDLTAPPELWFRLVATDSAVGNYTHPALSREDEVLFFSNANNRPVNDQDKQPLTALQTVSEEDFVSLNAVELSDVLTTRDRRIPPVAFIRISLGDLQSPLKDQQPLQFVVRFAARETRWKYYVLGDLATDSASVIDKTARPDKTRTAIEFDRREEKLADDRKAISFTSVTLIPLRHQYGSHFSLQDGTTGKVLISHLPSASPDRLYKETIDGKEAMVSDIYINS